MSRRPVLSPLLVVLVAVLAAGLAPLSQAAPKERPGAGFEDRYIVVLRPEVSGAGRAGGAPQGARVREATRELDRAHGLGVTHVYESVVGGFAAEVPDAAALRRLERDPRVAAVEPDRAFRFAAQELPTGVDRIGADSARENAPPTVAGRPVAVVDSGIDAGHPDLAGVVKGGYDCTTAQATWGRDGYGHGTHVAGIVAALNNDIGVVGVAPGTPLYDVRVGDDAGAIRSSWLLCGLDWVAQRAAADGIEVVNLSLAGTATAADHEPCGPTTTALHNAVCGLAGAGVTVVAAAGNGSTDANGAVPATYQAEVTTVSALVDSDGCTGGRGKETPLGRDDTRSAESNFGRDVDVAAPGVRITSTVPEAKGSYKRLSGTSMATPHVAAAYALGWNGAEEARKGLPEGILKLGPNTGC